MVKDCPHCVDNFITRDIFGVDGKNVLAVFMNGFPISSKQDTKAVTCFANAV